MFFDIDGTLVSFNTHEIPASTVEALTIAHKKGIKIFISSGRAKVIMNHLDALENRQLIDGYITMNGAHCFIGNTIVDSHPISRQSVLKVAQYTEKLNVTCAFIGIDHIKLVHPTKIQQTIYYDYLNFDPVPEASMQEALSDEIFQLTPFISPEQEEELMPQLPDCIAGRWHPTFTDITRKGCDKANGVRKFAEYLGITPQEIMCVGDGGNDLSMIQYAGIGVAMENAPEPVKEAATYVTALVDDDGIANALKHFNII